MFYSSSLLLSLAILLILFSARFQLFAVCIRSKHSNYSRGLCPNGKNKAGTQHREISLVGLWVYLERLLRLCTKSPKYNRNLNSRNLMTINPVTRSPLMWQKLLETFQTHFGAVKHCHIPFREYPTSGTHSPTNE